MYSPLQTIGSRLHARVRCKRTAVWLWLYGLLPSLAKARSPYEYADTSDYDVLGIIAILFFVWFLYQLWRNK